MTKHRSDLGGDHAQFFGLKSLINGHGYLQSGGGSVGVKLSGTYYGSRQILQNELASIIY